MTTHEEGSFMGKKNKADSTFADEVRAIQDDAREGFSLRDRLAGANNRRKTITIYTDPAAGAELGFATDESDMYGLKTGRRSRKGLVGQLDALEEEASSLLKNLDAFEEVGLEVPDADRERSTGIPGEIKKVKAEIAKLQAKLKGSSIEFTLRTVPDIVVRDARRRARLELEIKGKKIPEDRQEEYDIEYTVQLLVSSTESWLDNQDGVERTTLTIQQARDLRDFLPVGQFTRLDQAMVELSFEASIANSATDDADF